MQPICFLANTVKDIMKHTHSMRTHTHRERTHTFHPATTCSTRLGPAGSCLRGKMICSAFWFCLMTVSQRDTSLLLRSYATPLWICTHTQRFFFF